MPASPLLYRPFGIKSATLAPFLTVLIWPARSVNKIVPSVKKPTSHELLSPLKIVVVVSSGFLAVRSVMPDVSSPDDTFDEIDWNTYQPNAAGMIRQKPTSSSPLVFRLIPLA